MSDVVTDEERQRQQTLERILREARTQGEFPAIGKFLSELLSVVRSENVSARRIANLVLNDFSLTTSVLRMVNSAYYSSTTGQQVSTISRAVVLLGTDAVANIAGGLNIFEHFARRADIKDLKGITIHSLLTGLHARALATSLPGVHPEEAFICGMLHDLGRIAVAFYLPAERACIQRLTTDGTDDEAACAQVLGLTYAEIGQAVAKSWALPEHVQDALQGLGEGEAGRPASTGGRLRGIVSCARELATVAMATHADERAARLEELSGRFGDQLRLRREQLETITQSSGERFTDLIGALKITRRDLEQHAPGLVPRAPRGPEPALPDAKPAPGSRVTSPLDLPPSEVQALFTHALEELVDALASNLPLNDVFMMVLESLYRSIGFQHVLLALVTPARDALRGRYAIGPDADDLVRAFTVDLRSGASQDLLAGREIFVDLAEPRAGALFPAEVRTITSAKTALLLPLMVHGKAIGAFYVDRTATQPPLGEEGRRNVRTLAKYAVLAVRQPAAVPAGGALMDFRTTLASVTRALDAQGIPAALIGGVALAVLGVPRATGDIDFLADGGRADDVAAIMHQLGYDSLHRSAEVANFGGSDRIHVDFVFANRPLSHQMLARATRHTVLGTDRVAVLQAEDVIGLKVQASSNDPGRLALDLGDIERLILANRDLDLGRVREYFQLFARESEMDAILARHHIR